MKNDSLSWWELFSSGDGPAPFLIILGLITILGLLLWWAIKRFRKTYRWYLTRGDDEEKMEEELVLKQSIGEEYLSGGDEDQDSQG